MNNIDKFQEVLLSNDYPRARRAATELAQLNTLEAAALLRTALASQHRRVRQAAMWGVSIIKDVASVPQLLYILENDDTFLRRDAGYALGQIGEPAVDGLRAALRHKDQFTRRYAADGLRGAKSVVAVPDLIDALDREQNTPKSFVPYHLIKALVAIGDTSVIPALLRLLTVYQDFERGMIIGSLSELKAKEAVPVILKILQDEEEPESVRQRAAWALGSLKDISVISELLLLLNHKNWRIREAILAAFKGLADISLLPALGAMLDDEINQVRGKTIEAITNLKHPDAIPYLINAIQPKNLHSYLMIAYALKEIGTHEAIEGAEKAFLAEIEAQVSLMDNAIRKRINGVGHIFQAS